MSDSTLRIHLLSGPRNISTAMMYSFAQRSDTRVVDEPLYAHYLRVTGIAHPGREETLASQENDGQKVVEQELLGDWDRPVVFFKHIAKHVTALDRDFLLQGKVLFLIREPDQMLTSWIKQMPNPTLQETALQDQWELAQWLESKGQQPLVVDSKTILQDPKNQLTKLCDALGIPFDEHMLHWEAGARPEDGVWAPYWYDAVHQSTGFAPYKRKEAQVPERLHALLQESNNYYELLNRYAL